MLGHHLGPPGDGDEDRRPERYRQLEVPPALEEVGQHGQQAVAQRVGHEQQERSERPVPGRYQLHSQHQNSDLHTLRHTEHTVTVTTTDRRPIPQHQLCTTETQISIHWGAEE